MRIRCVALLIAAAVLTPGLTSAAPHFGGSNGRFCVSSIRGKFNSDGRRDTAVVYSTRHSCATIDARSWYLVVRLASGNVLRRPLGHDRPAFSGERDLGCDPMCAVRAAPDFNRDGRHEIAVSLQQGAAVEQRGIYGIVRGHLRRFRARTGDIPFSFAYGGSLSHGADVVCRTQSRNHLVAAIAWGVADGTHSSIQEIIYRFDGLRFHLIGSKTKRLSGSRIPPPFPGRAC
jgi:hypothetical protein